LRWYKKVSKLGVSSYIQKVRAESDLLAAVKAVEFTRTIKAALRQAAISLALD